MSDNRWAQTCGDRVSRTWAAFNKWRKRYWLTRVIILCLIFSPYMEHLVVRPPPLVRLVRIACDAILVGSEPQVTHQLAQYYKAREIHNLQTLVRAAIDTDGNHKLDAGEQQAALALGVNPNIVEAKAVKVDLNEIVAAARKLNISMSAPSAQTIRREAFFKALGETQLMFAANQQTIDSLLHYEYSFPDFSEWSTWRHGFLMFFSRLFYFFARFSGILLLWLPWLFVFFVLTLSAKDLLGVTSERVGALIALISAFILLGASFDPSVSLTSYLLYGIALAGVSCITGCWAIRFGKRARLNYRIGLPLAFFIAILLVALLGLPRTDLEMAWVPFGPIWVFGFCGWMAMAFIYSAFLCMFAGFGLVVIYYLSRIRLSGGDRHIPPKT